MADVDLEMRPVDEFGDPLPLDESLLGEVAAIDGVAAAAPEVAARENAIRPLNARGEEIPANGPPQLAFNWVDDERLSSLTVVEGEAPSAANEFTMDLDSAAINGFEVGGVYDVITPTGRTELTLSGTTRFGDDNDTLGATLMQFPTEALQDLIGRDGYDAVEVSLATDADRGAVQAQMEALSPMAEVVDNATLESEQSADFNQGIDLIGNVLLGFAGVSLFVSVFIIYNTFSIVLGQRTKELALLRTIGADPGQLRRSVIGESLVIGVLASAVGIVGGIGVAICRRSSVSSRS